jgi:two-component system CheB/CheR fusion protein
VERELTRTKERLRATIEEYETSREEMKATNEELRSINEEYKSTLEELETSKEEVQSMNEELQTVNAELSAKVDELSRANSDLENLMASTDIATLFLDRDLRIQRITPRVRDLFNVTDGDRGRPIGHFTAKVDYDDLEADANRVLRDLTTVETEAQGTDGTWFLVRLRPYRTVEDKIDGVVVSFIDITERKEAEKELQALNETLEKRVAERTHQVQALSRALDAAEQRERERIGQILHDDLQQLLYAVEMNLQLVEDTALPDDDAEVLASARGTLKQALETSRTLAADLTAPEVEGTNLHATLERLAERMQDAYDLAVSVGGPAPLEMADRGLHELVYRLTRELLFNVVKHADVDAARVEARYVNAHLHVAVADEGAGFDPEVLEAEEEGTGLGLTGMRERIELLGGRVEVESAPNQGTRVTLVLPRALGEEG